MAIPEAHRPFLEDMRALDRDAEGREKLVGLTVAETGEYFGLIADRRADRFASAPDRSAAADRYLELHDRHELARRRILLAEIEARQSGPRH